VPGTTLRNGSHAAYPGIFLVMPQTSSRFYLRISVFIRGHFLSSALSVAASFSPSFTRGQKLKNPPGLRPAG